MKKEIEIKSPYKVIEVKFERNYPGYIYRRELVDDSEYGGDGKLEMVNCYSNDTGDWIGDPNDARFLCKKKGLRQIQKRKETHSSCSIGFNTQEQKWYGWSHRAIHGFGVGSTVKKDDCAYVPIDKDDFLESIVSFWTDENRLNIKGVHQVQTDENGKKESGVYVDWTYSDKFPNKKISGQVSGVFNQYPEMYGKGAWEAKTLEDAKQMAIDFADGVS